MPRIAFLEVDPEDRTLVAQRYPDALVSGGVLKAEEIAEQCADSEIISCFINTPFPKTTLDKLPALKLLCTRSVGFDHIDLDACKEKGIKVCNVPDYGSHVIAEHVFALLLGTLRHIHEGDERVRQGRFDYHGLRGIALRGKTIGIVGTGRIGRKVAQIAHGFGMRILATDQCRTIELTDLLGVRYVPMSDLLGESDVLTLHVPGGGDTDHLINAKAFALMKNGAILINTARGSLIDSHALADALTAGKLGYALLDVLEHEKNFAENKALLSHPNVVSTPHIAFYADESMHNMYLDCFQTIDLWMAGQPVEHEVHPVSVVCDLPKIGLGR